VPSCVWFPVLGVWFPVLGGGCFPVLGGVFPCFGGCKLHVDMSATTTVALPTKREHPHCKRERSQYVLSPGFWE
jgi:hypothetical protein